MNKTLSVRFCALLLALAASFAVPAALAVETLGHDTARGGD